MKGAHELSHIAKLAFKTVARTSTKAPVIARRDKLVAGLKEQKLVHAATVKNEDHRIEKTKWMTNEHGERVLTRTMRRVRPWFFEQDGGWYVQCRYGARVIAPDGKNNAVFVKTLKEVEAVLDALLAAAASGELDTALAKAAERQSHLKPGTFKAAENA